MTNAFAHEFLDDYFAESEEHLALLRGRLLSFEERGGESLSPPDLKAMHRSLHTLKGLAGMVGFEEVEAVAHALEDALQHEPEGVLSRKGVVALFFHGVQLLDHALAARREGSGAVDVVQFLGEVAALGARSTAVDLVPAALPTVATEIVSLRFQPTPELVARGMGVEWVKERLQRAGVIRAVVPMVPPGGGSVVFDFEVEVAPGWELDRELAIEAISWTPQRAPSAAAGDDAATGERAAGFGAATVSNLVRVDLARLDDLMRLVGELVVSRSRLEDALGELDPRSAGAAGHALRETTEVMERQLRSLREGIMRVRLVPVGDVFERLRFAVRDLARESGKDVVVDVEGAETEVDRLVVDRMMEPLLHLVRNAVSHGIETSAERQAAGKPRRGRVALRASASGDRIRIEVEDDGAGVDRDAVRARARTAGLDDGGALDDARLLDLLCAAGFSTRAEADRASGRGVGMDVVRSTVRALNGELSLATEPGRGSRFTVDLPLTLMIVDALLVRVGGQTMAVPQPVLREVLKVEGDAATRMGDGEIIPYRGGVLPLVRLTRVFGLPPERDEGSSFHVLVVGDDGDRIGLAVEGLAGLREIVVHPIDDPLVATLGVGGATELTDGRLGLILDAAALTRDLRGRKGAGRPAREALPGTA